MKFSKETKFILRLAEIVTIIFGFIWWCYLLNYNEYYIEEDGMCIKCSLLYKFMPLIIYLLGCCSNCLIFLYDDNYYSITITLIIGIFVIIISSLYNYFFSYCY